MKSDFKHELARLATMVDHTVEKASEDWVVRGNDAAAEYNAMFNVLDSCRGHWNASFAGACLVQLFRTAPWLEAFTLDLSAESEYDDQGGSYRCVNLRAPNAQARSGAELPDFVQGDDAKLCEDLAGEWIEELFEDSVPEIYSAFVGDDGYDDVEFIVRRETIAHLIESSEPVSGKRIFELLFPDYAWRLATPAAHDGQEPDKAAATQTPAGREYLFDAKLLAAIRVRAESVEEARRKLGQLLDCARCEVEIDASGASIVFEASIDGEADLIEVDGKSV